MGESIKSRRTRRSGFWTYALLGASLAFLSNVAYQVWRKPAELVGAFEGGLHKTPQETWRAYGAEFEAKSTALLAPELLAALAQAETGGNPIARTYWRWKWTTDLARIYAPASSSVGLFQITDGTFEEAKQFCVSEGRVRKGIENGCWPSALRTRLLPSHAIEMTAGRLHWHVEKIAGSTAKRRGAALRDKRRLAAVVHLCGPQRGESFARSGFSLKGLGRCGDHDAAAYVRKIERLSDRFRTLRADSRVSAGEFASTP